MTPDSALDAPALMPAPTAPTAARSDIQITRRIACPPSRVWRALTDPEESAMWFAEVQVEPAQSGRFRAEWFDGDCAVGRVIAYEPHVRLVTTWHWQGVGAETTLAFDMHADDDGRATIVTFTHSGTDAAERHDYELGWTYYAARLADLCEERGVTQPKLTDYPSAIEMAIDLPVPPERVWQAITRDAELDRWFTRAHVEARVGGDVQFYGMCTGRLLERGRVTECDAPSRIALTWVEPGWPGETTLAFTLTPSGKNATRLTLTHGGWESLPVAMARSERRAKTCWRDALADLRAYLALARTAVPSDGFRRTHAIPTSAERVWSLLTHADAVAQWITMPDRALAHAALEPVVGGEVRIEHPDGDALLGRVTRVEPRAHMTWVVRSAGLGPEMTFAFDITPEASGEVFGVRVACTGRGCELETDRRAWDRRASVWMMQLYELATGEDLTRIESTHAEAIELTADIPTDPQHVFAALTRRESVVAWMCDRCEMDAVYGGAVSFETTVDDRTVTESGRVIEYRVGERLAYALEEADAGWGAPIVVTFDLRTVSGQTRLRLRASGWNALPLPLRDAARARAAQMWRQRLAALRDSAPQPTVAKPAAPAKPAVSRATDQRFGAETRGLVKPKRTEGARARPRQDRYTGTPKAKAKPKAKASARTVTSKKRRDS